MAWRGVAWRGVAVGLALGASLAGAQPYGVPQYGGTGFIEFRTMEGGPGAGADRVKALSASTLPTVAVPADALTIIAGQFNQDAVGRAGRPGILWAKVGIRRQHPDGFVEPVGQPGVWLSAQCCAFGGPLQLGVSGAEKETWTQIGRKPSGTATETAPNSSPWYLQFFRYSPAAPKPAGYQETQDATAALKYSQPEGVEWEWQPVAGTYSATLADLPPGSPHPASIDLQATEAFEEREVRCLFSADVFLQDGFQCGSFAQTYPVWNVTNTGEDDTEQSHYEAGVLSGKKDVETKMVSKLTAAEPGELTRILYQAYDPGPPSQRCGRRVLCNLKDTTGRNMPGVLCQERFPGGLPPGGKSNQTFGFTWHTRVSLGTGAFNGDWHAIDDLWYRWAGPDFPEYNFTQLYWVATGDHNVGGIPGRSLTVQLLPGTPGQCNQNGF